MEGLLMWERKQTWNLDELMAFTDGHPGKEIFDDASKSGVLRVCTEANWEQLVDWGTSSQPFNKELFIKILEYSNRLH